MTVMTPVGAQAAIKTITNYAILGDHEAAHAAYLRLVGDTLATIAAGAADAQELAALAVQAGAIEFKRW